MSQTPEGYSVHTGDTLNLSTISNHGVT